MRPGAHDGHIVGQDIQELGQFVDTVFSEDLTEPGDAFVALNGGEKVVRGGRLVSHGPELIDGEGRSGDAEAVRLEEDRTFTGQLDSDGDQQTQGGKQEDHQGGEADIECTFQETIGIRIQGEGPHLEQGDIAEVANLEMDIVAARKIGNEVGADTVPFRDGDERFNFVYFTQGQNDEGIFEGAGIEDLLEVVDGTDHVMVRVFGGKIGEQADGFDAEVFIGQEVILELGTQLVVPDDDSRFQVEVRIEEITKEEPGRNTEFQQQKQGDGGDILMFGAGALVGDQEEQGGEGKIVDEAPDQRTGHFGVVGFQVAQIFDKNGADDDVADIENNQKILQAFRVAFVEK